MATSLTTRGSPYEPLRVLSAEAVLQQMRSNVPLTVLDVRDRPQFQVSGVIAGARAIPLVQLSARLEELAGARATPVVVVSQMARRAVAAVLELQAAGFAEVFLLDGGMERWRELGYPVEQRRDSTPSARAINITEENKR